MCTDGRIIVVFNYAPTNTTVLGDSFYRKAIHIKQAPPLFNNEGVLVLIILIKRLQKNFADLMEFPVVVCYSITILCIVPSRCNK
jgi:hypothetical protein